ncbi:MAG: branched-chain-amino-acid transaminase [Chlamydiae bacterium]|nr:MAG: branched-chain-amino-acid transaminase [Chlamydiota bacterium]
MIKPKVNINGEIFSPENAKISVFDHGLLYGDGVFEGIRFYNSKIFKFDEHIDRLDQSARHILLKLPMSLNEIKQETIKTIKASNMKDGYIRLIVTRGVGTLGISPYKCEKAQLIIIVDIISLYPEELYENGMEIITVPTQRNMSEAVSPRVKSLNYLNNVLAKIEAVNAGFEEAIMLNKYGFVAECTGDNIFIVKNKTVITPPAYMGALEGITRNTVMEIATEMGKSMDISVKQRVMSRHDVFSSDECFLTGTAAEVIPVTKVDGRPIGNGKVGEITETLRKAFLELTQTTGTPIYE